MKLLAGKSLILAVMMGISAVTLVEADVECTVEKPYIPDPRDCTSWNDCIDVGGGSWLLVLSTCPAGGIWNQASGSCIIGTCKDSLTATVLVETAEEIPQYSCPSAGLFPDPVDCLSYYQCVLIRGVWYRNSHMCPTNSYFNKVTKRCTIGTCPPV